MYLGIWDIGGQEVYSAIRKNYYANADGIFLVFDITNVVSFIHLVNWHREITEVCRNVPIALIGNKADLEHFAISTAEMEKKREDFEAIGSHLTSAKSGSNVDLAFTELCKQILEQPVLNVI